MQEIFFRFEIAELKHVSFVAVAFKDDFLLKLFDFESFKITSIKSSWELIKVKTNIKYTDFVIELTIVIVFTSLKA